jgi:hypothetical protein
VCAALVALAVAAVAPGRAAHADIVPPVPDPEPGTAPTGPGAASPIDQLLSQLAVLRAREQVPVVTNVVQDRQVVRDTTARAVAADRAEVGAAQQRLADARHALATLAVAAYVNPGYTTLESVVTGDFSRNGRAQALSGSVLDRQRARVVDARETLDAAQHTLDADLDAQRRAAADVRAAQQSLAVAQQQVATAEGSLGVASASSSTAAGDAGSLPIMSASVLSGNDLAAWYASRGWRPRVPVSISDLANWFVSEGADEGVRGDVAFAQAIIETGAFSSPDAVNHNNYGGIGHCDSCGAGIGFASPQAGVRAQIQLLKRFAVRDPSFAHPLVAPGLRGRAGCCPMWGDLAGSWATDPTYGAKIATVYRQMLAWLAASRRSG